MLPPVTALPHSFQITPHSTCIAVCVRMSWCRRSQSTAPVTSSPDARHRAVERVPHVLAFLAHVGDGRARQRARVVRLPAAGRIERGAVERHAVAVDLGHGRRELLEVRVAQVQQFGRHTSRPYVRGTTRCRPCTSWWPCRPW